MNKSETIEALNKLGKQKTPFLFIIDYKMNNNQVIPLDAVDTQNILYNVNGVTNAPITPDKSPADFEFKAEPVTFEQYNKAFNNVFAHLKQGNSYLTNLTFETPIKTSLTLLDIFHRSNALYKLWFNDEFVVFSPEIFIKIIDNKIFSFPMKGTIDASLINAREEIIKNPKESAEHATITDLIRNDLSMVATNVKVDNYRFIDTIKTNKGDLLQVSSKISGELSANYQEKLGDMLFKLLPAGSISGAPKPKTLDIIAESENYQRGFYTGIFGIFTGSSLDCGVMIRYIEKRNEKFYFKSGGGITINSDARSEYEEMIKKVYLPFG